MQKIERYFLLKEVKDITPITVFYYYICYHLSLKMPSTRSGIIYNTRASSVATSIATSIAPSIASKNQPIISATEPRKSPRLASENSRFEGKIHRPMFFEPITQQERPRRSNRTAFPAELIREFCDESDNDSTSDYEIEDEEVQQYTRNSFLPVTLPRYEVNIDFDEASAAWRSNKRRVGESWVYKLNPKHPENFRFEIIDDAVASVTSHVASRVASNVASSVASRVKQRRSANI